VTRLDPPRERECERCGRQDVWDEAVREWRIVETDGERHVGNPQCIHEWDITGSYVPLAEE
jgi:hypothetical protein